jgi:MarR family transcriptional regulator for hemolysin
LFDRGQSIFKLGIRDGTPWDSARYLHFVRFYLHIGQDKRKGATLSSSPNFIEEVVNVTRRMRTVFDGMVKERGMTLARAHILRKLGLGRCGASQKALAEELEIEGPTLVRLLDHLEQAGCIKRVPVEGDRRTKQIVLTDTGRCRAEEVAEVAGRFSETLLRDIEPDELEVAFRVMSKMAHNLEGHA